jgi:hypothetical protein
LEVKVLNAIAKEIVDAAFRIHTTLGPGLLESTYQTVLAYELGRRGLRTVSQQLIPVVYENVRSFPGFEAIARPGFDVSRHSRESPKSGTAGWMDSKDLQLST